MANVSGFSVEEHVYTCEKIDKCDQVGWIEVNVSCPNVHGGGMSFGTSPEAAAEEYVAVAVKRPSRSWACLRIHFLTTVFPIISRSTLRERSDVPSLAAPTKGRVMDARREQPRKAY